MKRSNLTLAMTVLFLANNAFAETVRIQPGEIQRIDSLGSEDECTKYISMKTDQNTYYRLSAIGYVKLQTSSGSYTVALPASGNRSCEMAFRSANGWAQTVSERIHRMNQGDISITSSNGVNICQMSSLDLYEMNTSPKTWSYELVDHVVACP